MKFAFDTVTGITKVTESSFHTLGTELKHYSRHLVEADGNPITVATEAEVCVEGKV